MESTTKVTGTQDKEKETIIQEAKARQKPENLFRDYCVSHGLTWLQSGGLSRLKNNTDVSDAMVDAWEEPMKAAASEVRLLLKLGSYVDWQT